MDRSRFGAYAEQLATDFLTKRGYAILDRNYRKPWGELDIISEKENIIVFVEVKANWQAREGFEPELRADWRKRQKIIRTARTYLLQKMLSEREWQIDIISVTLNALNSTAKVKHFRNIDLT
jgi:putative endonuclease